MQGPHTEPFLAQVLTVRANLAQVLWLAALAGTGLALFAAARPGTRMAALLPVVLGAVAAVQVVPRQLDAAWVEDRRATELICTHDAPTICIPRRYADVLPALREPGRQALAVLETKLPPPAPTRIMVDSQQSYLAHGPQSADTLFVLPPINEYGEVEASTADLLRFMLSGGGTRPCANVAGPRDAPDTAQPKGAAGALPADARYVVARMAVAAWLLDEDLRADAAGEPLTPEERATRQALTVLRSLPASEQRARVAAVRDAERTCADGDRLALLTGGKSQ
jgi:hypothetical protein